MDNKVHNLSVQFNKHEDLIASHETQIQTIKAEVKVISDAHKAMVDLLNKIFRTMLVFGFGMIAESVIMDGDSAALKKFANVLWTVVEKM